ncbi:hypothetical protein HMPREF9134_00202 [Porphyromonas catoniae F0037]|uniref:Uncharacterized protein n=1 Tax=Porphyromonas catoniae F0037 TaxID=1127696 RepID=L1NI59_9PORP|nr:hypothetical protein HMPREF9134_00202 [Porphyromonas catoniae F0037]
MGGILGTSSEVTGIPPEGLLVYLSGAIGSGPALAFAVGCACPLVLFGRVSAWMPT